MALGFASLLDGAGIVASVIDQAIRKAVEDAYRQGFRDGIERTRQSVMASFDEIESTDDDLSNTSASLDVPVTQSAVRQSSAAVGRAIDRARPKARQRVERGAIGEAVDQVLQRHAGATLAQIVEEVRSLGVDASREGVGMHLRRNAETRYRQDGRKWFPRGKAETETAGDRQPRCNPRRSLSEQWRTKWTHHHELNHQLPTTRECSPAWSAAA